MFMNSVKMKLRFPTKVGLITTEDLWDLPLTSENNSSLNDTAQQLHRELKASEEENFVTAKSSGDKITALKLDIVKAVIADKLEEAEKRKNAAARKEQKETIMAIIADKQNEALAGKSVAALQKMLDSMD